MLNKKNIATIFFTVCMVFTINNFIFASTSHEIYNILTLSNSNQNDIISQQEAEIIALEILQGQIIRTELDRDDGITYFEVYMQLDTGMAEIYINAHTGELIEIDYDNHDSNVNNSRIDNQISDTSEINPVQIEENTQTNNIIPNNTDNRTVSSSISLDDAKRIALDSVSNRGRIISTDFDRSGGMGTFSIYLLTGATIQEIYIDAQTGQIMDIDSFNLILIAIIAFILIGIPILIIVMLLRKRTNKNNKNSN